MYFVQMVTERNTLEPQFIQMKLFDRHIIIN